jgi:hypothetical protein
LARINSLSESLRVRRALWKFWRSVLAREAPGDQELGAVLLAVGASIARLEGREEYREMRIDDRIQLRQLHERLRGWLSSPRSEVADARRLWQDVVGYATLLRQVNLRAELIAHDHRIAAESLAELREQAVDAPCPPALRRRLQAMHGRSEELDQLLEDPACSAAELSELLGHVEGTLARQGRGTPGDPWGEGAQGPAPGTETFDPWSTP